MFIERILFYLNNIIITFLKSIEENKEKIITMKNFKPIKIKVCNFDNKKYKDIIELIGKIINFWIEKKIF